MAKPRSSKGELRNAAKLERKLLSPQKDTRPLGPHALSEVMGKRVILDDEEGRSLSRRQKEGPGLFDKSPDYRPYRG